MKKILSLAIIMMLLLSLAACGGGKEEAAPAKEEEVSPESTGRSYDIRVTDQNGDPVNGAVVNICTDTTCAPVTSDENGLVPFTGEKADYHLEIIKVPEGYEIPEGSDLQTGDETSVTLTVTKK